MSEFERNRRCAVKVLESIRKESNGEMIYEIEEGYEPDSGRVIAERRDVDIEGNEIYFKAECVLPFVEFRTEAKSKAVDDDLEKQYLDALNSRLDHCIKASSIVKT
jgi:hypothetical protein